MADKNRQDNTFKILAVKHIWFDATKCVIPEIEKALGMKVEIDYIYDEWEMYQKSKELITSDFSTYDLFMVDSIWIYEYVRLGMLECLEDYFTKGSIPPDYQFEDLIPQYIENFCRVNGRLYTLPLSGHTNFLSYRKDLLQQKGLQVPVNQAELLICARNLTSDNIAGITLRGRGFELAYTYMLFFYPNGGQVLDENCHPCLNSPQAMETLEYLTRLWRYTPSDILHYSFPEMSGAFKEGKSALYHDASVGAILIHNCPLAGHFGYATAPAGKKIKTCIAGWGMGIPRASLHKKEAFYYLSVITGKKVDAEILRRGRDPIRLSTLQDETLKKEFPFLSAIEENLKFASPWFRPPVPELASVLNILGDNIALVLKKSCGVKEGLKKAQVEISTYLSEAGY